MTVSDVFESFKIFGILNFIGYSNDTGCKCGCWGNHGNKCWESPRGQFGILRCIKIFLCSSYQIMIPFMYWSACCHYNLHQIIFLTKIYKYKEWKLTLFVDCQMLLNIFCHRVGPCSLDISLICSYSWKFN